MDNLVSIIVPCYNMAKKIGRLFDSILAQTYKNLQIIVVNDGSTDDSEKVILSYSEKFVKQGMQIDYVKLENQGVGAAVDTGLKHVKGDFFCWPDADDWLVSNSIEARLRFLLTHTEYDFVRSDAFVFYEADLKHPIGYISNKHPDRFKSEELLLDYIWERNTIVCPGCHLVCTASFKKVCNGMNIYRARGGQNFQLLAPMLCNFKFGYIDEPLYCYVIYKKSLSHGDKCLEDFILRINMSDDIRAKTLETLALPQTTIQNYINQNRQVCNIARTQASYNFGDSKSFKYYYSQIDEKFIPTSLLRIHKSIFLSSVFWLKLHKVIFRFTMRIRESNFAYYIRAKRFKYKYD